MKPTVILLSLVTLTGFAFLIFLIHSLSYAHLKAKYKASFMNRKVATENTETSCENFEFKRADWTLLVKDRTGNDECKQNLSSLLEGNLVKRIFYENGTVIDKGCSSNTTACSLRPYFDDINKIRINTPPCCIEKVKAVYENFARELLANSITHMLVFGGVIGWMRNKKMVPYDIDLDVIIDGKYWDKPALWSLLRRLEERYGYKYLVKDKGQKIYLSFSAVNDNGIDIWPYHIRTHARTGGSYVFIPHNFFTPQPVNDMIPPKEVQFENFTTYIPRNPQAYLDSTYGKDKWYKELDCMKRDGRKCV